MNIRWDSQTWADGSVVRTVLVSDQSDWPLFERVANALQHALGGEWCKQADTLDQRCWELAAGAGRIILDLDLYLGITMFAARAVAAAEASDGLLTAAFELLVDFEAA